MVEGREILAHAMSRITHSAAMRLGPQMRSGWAYSMKLKRTLREKEDYLFALGVATLEVMNPETRLVMGPQRLEPRSPDMMISMQDLEFMKRFLPVQRLGDPQGQGEQEAGGAVQMAHPHSPAGW